MIEMEEMLNITQTARILGVSEKTVSRWIRSRKLTATVYGPTLVRIPVSEVSRFKKEHTSVRTNSPD